MGEIVTKLLQTSIDRKSSIDLLSNRLFALFSLYFERIFDRSMTATFTMVKNQRGADRRQTMDVRSLIVVALQKQFTPNSAESLMQPAKIELYEKITLF